MLAVLVFFLAIAGLTLLIMYRYTRFARIFVGLCASVLGILLIIVAASIIYDQYSRRSVANAVADHTNDQNIRWEDLKPDNPFNSHAFIEVMCDRGYDKHEVFEVKLDDKNVFVELRGRNESINEIKAEKTFPIYSVTGKVSKTGSKATPSKIALGQKLPPDNEQSWTVYFGDHGENSLAMSLTSAKYGDGEVTYYWGGQLNMQPGVKVFCNIDY